MNTVFPVREFGDDVTPYTNEECLVVCNHQSTGDVPTLMYSFYSKTGVCNKMMWIMDIMFKYTNFGFVSQVHKDFFIMQVHIIFIVSNCREIREYKELWLIFSWTCKVKI